MTDRIAEEELLGRVIKGRELAERVRIRLGELGISATQAARSVGLDGGFITDILRGRKSSIQGRNFERLAKALQWTAADLVEFGSSDRRVSDRNIGFDESIPILGQVAPGVWIDTQLETPGPLGFVTHNPVFSGYTPDSQFDILVKGTSLNNIAVEGQYIRCHRENSLYVNDEIGSVVIFERFKETLRERIALKLIGLVSDKYIFGYDSSDPRWTQQYIMHEDGSSDCGRFSKIGDALFVYTVLPGIWEMRIKKNPDQIPISD